ncbi:MAG: hypothetical protein IJ689_04135 [Alphaproteobacteria bacterium]|nr:hypothetical protein [Alphaproteobacteria bacterium]
MKTLIEVLKEHKNISLGEKVDVRNNIDARKYLAEEGMAVFPDEFFSYVKYANGIRSDSAEIYAILPEEDKFGFTDAVFANERLHRIDADNVSVLGKNEFDYLVYDKKENQYQLRDKNNDSLTACFGSLTQAIRYMFEV